MSAYVVGFDLIDLLTTAAIEGGPHERGLRVQHKTEDGCTLHVFDRADGHTLAQILHDANVASVNARYGETATPETAHVAFVRNIGGTGATWGDVLNALSCYEYQTCEIEDSGSSLAAAIVSAIRAKVLERFIPQGSPWEWTRTYQAAELDKARKAARAHLDTPIGKADTATLQALTDSIVRGNG